MNNNTMVILKTKTNFLKSIVAFSLILVSLLFVSKQSGAQALYEAFDYTVGGNIGGNTSSAGGPVNNWFTHSASTTGTIDVLSGSLSYSGLLASSGNKVSLPGNSSTGISSRTTRDVNRFVNITGSNVAYFSALINVVDSTNIKVGDDYFMHFSADSGITNSSYFARLGIKRASNIVTNYVLSISNISGGTTTYTPFAQELTFGTTYLVVVKYDTTSKTASLWVNPTSLGGAEPSGQVTNTSGTSAVSKFAAICIRNSVGTPKVDIDEIRVGTTWAEVTPTGATDLPTLSVSSSPASFGGICVGVTSSHNSFVFSGTNLTTDDIQVGPLSGYQFSTDSTTGYADSLTLSHAAGSYNNTIYVKFTPTSATSYNANALVSGGGAPSVTVSLSGSGLPNNPSVTTNPAVVDPSTWAVVVSANVTAGCSEVTEYGLLYAPGPDSLTDFANQTHNALNTLSGSVFTDTANNLGPNETYYYVAYIITAGDTVYGAQQHFTTGETVLTSSANSLNFGTVCTSSDSIRSIRITGHYLTTDPITIDYIDGFTFAVDSIDGSYNYGIQFFPSNSSTNIDTTIFVKFNPSTAAAYNDSILIYNGTDTIVVRLSGNGVSTPILVTDAATSVTDVDAVLNGNITRSCDNTILEYGFIYGTDTTLLYSLDSSYGITVAAANLSGTNDGTFSQTVNELNPNTTYYSVAYAITANADTVYGEPHVAFTTFGPSLSASTLASFGVNCLNTVTGPNSFVVSGSYLNSSDVVVGPLVGYSFSTSASGTYDDSVVISQAGGTLVDTIYVKFSPTAIQSYNGSISITGGGAPTYNVIAVGSGAPNASVATGSSSAITDSSVTLSATTTEGCQSITSQGFLYGTLTSGDQTVLGTVSGSSFSASLSGLQDSTTYYYVAYIVSGGDTTYGTIDSVTTLSAAPVNVLVVTTVGTTDIYSDAATLIGSVTCPGSCGITSYGFVYSGSQSFNPQTAPYRVQTATATNNNFSIAIDKLVQNTVYYFRAFVVAAGDTVYADEEKMFTTSTVKPGFNVYPTPATTGSTLKFSISNIQPGPYQVRLINAVGQLVSQTQKTVSGTNTVMQDQFIVPSNIAPGMYFIQVASPSFRVQKEIIIH